MTVRRNDSEVPSKFTPNQAMALCDIRNAERFLKYVKDGKLDYVIENDEIHFKEKNIVDFVCNHWDPEDRPNFLDDLDAYCDLEKDWSRIKGIANDLNVNDKIYDVVVGKNTKSGSEYCLVCGDTDIFSKNVCKSHYNKIKYRFDEVTPSTVKQFEHQQKSEEERWSRDYPECRECGTTNKKHHAKGYCTRCYASQ